MKFITLNKLNENLRNFFDTIVLSAIKKRRIIVWDKLEDRQTETDGSVLNKGLLVGERYSYVSEPLTLESAGKTINIYGPDGVLELSGTLSVEFQGLPFASLAIWDGNYCYKIKGSY